MKNPADTEELLEAASRGDAGASHALLERHRDRLERMVAMRMDRRIRKRIDPADVVQEAITDAWKKLPTYLEQVPLPFYPWLRRIAWERLVKQHLAHVEAQRRSVRREVAPWDTTSSRALIDAIARSQTSPSGRAIREELREQVRRALDDLADSDREVLLLLYLEQLTIAEAAAVLGVSVGAVKMRHLRALKRLRGHIEDDIRKQGDKGQLP